MLNMIFTMNLLVIKQINKYDIYSLMFILMSLVILLINDLLVTLPVYTPAVASVILLFALFGFLIGILCLLTDYSINPPEHTYNPSFLKKQWLKLDKMFNEDISDLSKLLEDKVSNKMADEDKLTNFNIILSPFLIQLLVFIQKGSLNKVQVAEILENFNIEEKKLFNYLEYLDLEGLISLNPQKESKDNIYNEVKLNSVSVDYLYQLYQQLSTYYSSKEFQYQNLSDYLNRISQHYQKQEDI